MNNVSLPSEITSASTANSSGITYSRDTTGLYDSSYSSIANSLITSPTHVYIKYTATNVLRVGSTLYSSNQNDLTVSSRYVYSGSHILGQATNTVSTTTYDLTTSSGIYKFVKNNTTNWSISRKLGFKVADDVGSYWNTYPNENSNNEYVAVYDTSGNRISPVVTRTTSNKQSQTTYLYVDYDKTSIVIKRVSNSSASSIWNSSGTISLSSYSSTNYTLMKNYNWWDTWTGSWCNLSSNGELSFSQDGKSTVYGLFGTFTSWDNNKDVKLSLTNNTASGAWGGQFFIIMYVSSGYKEFKIGRDGNMGANWGAYGSYKGSNYTFTSSGGYYLIYFAPGTNNNYSSDGTLNLTYLGT